MNTKPVWAEFESGSYAALSANVSADVLIIGGGITGITASYFLAKAGKAVVLLEKHRLCGGETVHTTAHISYPCDERWTDLVKNFGAAHAQAVWDSGAAAAMQIAGNVREEKIDCDLRHIPGYLYAAGNKRDPQEIEQLQKEAAQAHEMGFDTHFVDACPVTGQPAIAFANMLKFHPLRYALKLAQAAAEAGAQICEESEVTEFGEDGLSATCNGHKVKFKHVFIATHVPLQGHAGTMAAALLQTKLAAYSTYAIGACVPTKDVPEALWWDTSDPYLYLRVDHDADGAFLIIGGEDHKTGQVTETEAVYAALEAKLRSLFPHAEITHRWSGQVMETVDGLPYIGEYAGQYIATGFSGTGMTFGTLAAMMFKDHVLGIANPWSELFRVERKKLSSTWDYLKENKDYPYYLVKSLFMGEKENLSELAVGEGKLIRHQGKKVAAYRGEDGQICLRSAICPHMGCVVNWNTAEKTWDCPCHGSRFTPKGDVIGGPAETALSELS